MNFPKSAKRVFKGKIFDVYQWRQKMFDGSYKIFERAIRQDTVIILASVKNKVVVLKQMQPDTGWFYCTPSGRMDIPGEKPLAAAKRELLEETGMVSNKITLWRKETLDSGKVFHNRYIYVARDCKKVGPQKLDPGERIKITYLDFDKFLKLSDHPQSPTWLAGIILDMFKARIYPKYKQYLKKVFFG